MRRLSLALLTVLVAYPAVAPAVAQERGGVPMRNAASILGDINANRGCPMSSTSVTVGLNQAMAAGSSAQQQLSTMGGSSSGCRPLVSTQVVAGVNMSVGRGSSAGQTITAQGQRGLLATNAYTRGYNVGYGSMSNANQHITNQFNR
jgi:hypothetical protein